MGKELDTLLETQRRLFDALLALAGKQLDAARGDAPEETLLAMLAERARVMEQLNAADERIRALADGVTAANEVLINSLQDTVKEIMALDAESARLLGARRDDVVEQMESMNRGAAALKGYGKSGGGQGRYISRKG